MLRSLEECGARSILIGFVAVREADCGPERSLWLAALESGVGGIAVTAAGDRRNQV